MKKLIFSFMLLLMFAVTGCGGSEKNEYKVYFKDREGYKLVEKTYQATATDLAELSQELLEAMNKPPKTDDYKIIKNEGVELLDISIKNKVVFLYFSADYDRMDSVSEILYRTAVVKTLTQIEGIDYVSIYSGGELIKYSNGSIVGLMAADDFVDDADSQMSNLAWTSLKLYFANDNGDRLTPQTIQVAYSKSVNIEKVIVEQLIAGPNGNNLKATLPSDLTLLGISVKNGVCYVNLSSSMSSSMVNVTAEVSIYSVVNSLCELANINSVAITIDGKSDIKFRESISLDQLFEPDFDLVTQS
ncbi:MAG: GerMN domain-containing protein [Lachnospiraceae bacterium]